MHVKSKMKYRFFIIILVLVTVFSASAYATEINCGMLDITVMNDNSMLSNNAIFQLETQTGASIPVTKISNEKYTFGGSVYQLQTVNGKIIIDNIPVGNYILRQVSSDNGYSLDKNAMRMITITNQQTSTLYFLQNSNNANNGTNNNNNSNNTNNGTNNNNNSNNANNGTNNNNNSNNTNNGTNNNNNSNNSNNANNGNIIVSVVDSETKKGISGCQIQIIDSYNNVIATITTDANGDAFSSSLNAGNYFIRQMNSSANYEVDTSLKNANVSNGTNRITLTNTPIKTTLKIIAVDNTGKRINNVTFNVVGNDTNQQGTTDTNGESIIADLAQKQYTVSVNTTPAGYENNNQTQSINLSKTNNTVTFSFTKKVVQSTFYIMDNNSNPVNTIVTITKENGQKIGNYKSISGYCNVPNLETGNYFVHVSTTKWKTAKRTRFTVEKNDDTEFYMELAVTAQTGKIQVNVFDGNGNGLEKAYIDVYNANKKKIATWTADDDGSYSDENLKVGTYYLVARSTKNVTKKSYTKVVIKARKSSIINLRANQGAKGTVIVYFKNADTNQEISASYSYTDNIGTDFLEWLKAKNVDKKSISGYTFTKADYPATTKLTDEVQTVTYWYTAN